MFSGIHGILGMFLYVLQFLDFFSYLFKFVGTVTFFRACACANYIPMNYTSKWRCPHIFVSNGRTVKYCLKTHIPYSIDYHPHPRGGIFQLPFKMGFILGRGSLCEGAVDCVEISITLGVG